MSQQVPPHVQLIEMGIASWVSTVLYAAAETGLADRLAEPQSAADLAPALGLHAPSLHRLMRTLASLGVLTQVADERFALTPLGGALKSDAPGAARSTLRTFGSAMFTRALENVMWSLETGKTGFEKAHGIPVFDFLAQHQDQAARFSETMVGFHGGEPPAVAAAYDFSGFESVVDVGGATGNMLAHILTKHAKPRGVLFDLPHVIGEAPALLKQRGVEARVTTTAGSFFETVPAGGDAYLLSHIIHDWSEEQCLTILGNCRKAMKPTGRLLIVEMVLPAGDAPHPGKLLDMIMLTIPGGQERTEAEYTSLLAKAGFRLARVVPTESAVSVVEALPA